MAVDEATYPRPRVSRPGPTPSALAVIPGVEAVTAPASRSFAFAIDMNAGRRSSVSSPRLYGPAIIRGLHAINTSTGQVHMHLELGISPSAVQEVDVLHDAVRPWRAVFERLSATVAAEDAGRRGLVGPELGQPGQLQEPDLGIIVLDPEFFLVVSWGSFGGTGARINGHVNVLERVAAETIASFQ